MLLGMNVIVRGAWMLSLCRISHWNGRRKERVETQFGGYCSLPDQSDRLSDRSDKEQYPLTGSRTLSDRSDKLCDRSNLLSDRSDGVP